MIAAARKKGLPALKLANAMGIARSTAYYAARPPSPMEQQIVARIRPVRRKLPTAGRRKMVKLLAEDGLPISQGRVARIMRKYNLGPIRVTGGCTRRNRRAGRVPNRLASRVPQASNDCWAGDLTMVPVGDRGYMHVCVVIDLYSRKLLAARASNTGNAALCCATLNDAIRHYGTPQMFHSDQGSTYTAALHCDLLAKHRIVARMTEAGYQDNAKTERLIGTLKNEFLRLFHFENGAELEAGLAAAKRLYNTERSHASHNQQKPADVYDGKAKMNRGDLPGLPVADHSSELGDSLDLP